MCIGKESFIRLFRVIDIQNKSIATAMSDTLLNIRYALEPLAKIEDHLFYTGGCFTFDLRQRSDKQQETTDILSVVLQFRPK
jgi:hypothetical protein